MRADAAGEGRVTHERATLQRAAPDGFRRREPGHGGGVQASRDALAVRRAHRESEAGGGGDAALSLRRARRLGRGVPSPHVVANLLGFCGRARRCASSHSSTTSCPRSRRTTGCLEARPCASRSRSGPRPTSSRRRSSSAASSRTPSSRRWRHEASRRKSTPTRLMSCSSCAAQERLTRGVRWLASTSAAARGIAAARAWPRALRRCARPWRRS